MGLPTVSSPISPREVVIVVVDANRDKGNMEALDWALKHVVRPRDSIVVLGVLYDLGKKNYSSSCFPLNMGITISGIWERLEFSLSGQGEVRPRELGQQIQRKKEQYQISTQPFYRQCRRNEVKLEVKLAAGYCPAKITINEAKTNSNTRWIVLDSHLKKHKDYIYENVGCRVAIMKEKDTATLMSLKPPPLNSNSSSYYNHQTIIITANDHQVSANDPPLENLQTTTDDPTEAEAEDSGPEQIPESPSWCPLSWRVGFPRAFDLSELEDMTNEFSDNSLIGDWENVTIFLGHYQETPVILKSFQENDERYWSMLMILSRIRHRNIKNLIGYCCTGASRFLLTDYPYFGSVEANLLVDESAIKLSWKARWNIAIEIGGSLRYLHEECDDGPIAHLSLSSSHIVFSHGCSPLLCNFVSAKWLKNDPLCDEESLPECPYLQEDVHDYGVFLVELITGKSARLFSDDGRTQSFLDWAVPLLKKESLRQLMDPRLMNNNNKDDDCWVVHHMAQAALLSLKIHHSSHKPSITEVLAVVRGDQFAISKFQVLDSLEKKLQKSET
ncbi:hypothetical protein ACOSP7_004371 [Xanthoceras sorbifolium]